MPDLVLAGLHHLLAFGLVAHVAAQAALARRDPADPRKQVERGVMLARLPMQLPLIRIALKAAGRV